MSFSLFLSLKLKKKLLHNKFGKLDKFDFLLVLKEQVLLFFEYETLLIILFLLLVLFLFLFNESDILSNNKLLNS